MRVALISFFLLLGLVEAILWLRPITLPIPAMLTGGAILAILSNWGYLRRS